jgi:hypothetical protein
MLRWNLVTTVNTSQMRHHTTNTDARKSPAPAAVRAGLPGVVLAMDGVKHDDEASVGRARFVAVFPVGALFLFLASWLFITNAQAGQLQSHVSVDDILITDFGIYEPQGGKDVTLPTGVPRYTVDDVQLVAETNTIPAKLGTKFGFRYRIVGNSWGAPVAIKVVTLYPPAGAVSPKLGLIHSASLLKTAHIGASNAIAYSADEPWEMVPGIWTIQLWVGSKKLAERTFNMIPQQSAGG